MLFAWIVFMYSQNTQLILDRVEADRGDSVPDRMTGAKLFLHLSDPIVWIMGEVSLYSSVEI